MAPEVLTGSTADERSDIYSIGATLYDLLTGAPPFPGDDVHAVFVAHLTERPLPPSVRRGGSLPIRLEQLVLSCLEKDPDRRPRSVRDLLGELEDCLDVPQWSREEAERWWRAARIAALPPADAVPLPHPAEQPTSRPPRLTAQ